MRAILSSISHKELSSKELTNNEDLKSVAEQDNCWLDVQDFDADTLKSLGEFFSLDPLTLEDIGSGKQRIKTEDYQTYIFSVSKGVVNSGKDDFEYSVEEIFLVLSEKKILTLHKGNSTIVTHTLDSLKNRAKTLKKEAILNSLVFHTIYDFSVDSFYTVLSEIENWLVSIRSEVLDFDYLKAKDISDVKNLLGLISKARKELSELRIMLSQHRDVVSLAERGSVNFLSVDLMPAFRDVYDHTFQLIETLDSYMLRTGDMRDLYFTMRAAFTDNILRLLTIVATIFLPLTFLTGFYGMNFTAGFSQPGTGSIAGFWAMVVFMISMVVVLLVLFKRRGWV